MENPARTELNIETAAALSATAAAVAASADALSADAPPASVRIGRYRWVICALLFFAATINYVDRQVIGILKPTLQPELGWSEVEYSWIVFSFQTAYALGLALVGRLMDWLGARKGLSLSIIFWSVAAM